MLASLLALTALAMAPSPTASTQVAQGPTTEQAVVVGDDTLVYEQPSLDASVVRRLFVGELVNVSGTVTTDAGQIWQRLSLGYGVEGYVPARSVSGARSQDTVHHRPARIVREELPLALGVRIGGESLGGSLLVRYQPFSRLGITLGIGSIIANKHRAGLRGVTWPIQVHGMTYSAAVSSYLMLANISPFIELGLANINYDSGEARLSLTNVFTTVGFEVMHDSGAFIGASLTFARSLQSRVSYSYRGPEPGPTTLPDFEVLNLDDGVFHAVQPAMHIGLAF